MPRYGLVIKLAAPLLLLTACASTPDPAKVCTADWIGQRSDKAISNIEKKAKPALSKLSKAAASWAIGKKPGPLQLWSLQGSVKSLTKELESGSGLRDLKTLANTCNDPKIVTSAMTNLMKSNGLSQGMINFVEKLPLYRDIILKDLAGLQTPVANLQIAPSTAVHGTPAAAYTEL